MILKGYELNDIFSSLILMWTLAPWSIICSLRVSVVPLRQSWGFDFLFKCCRNRSRSLQRRHHLRSMLNICLQVQETNMERRRPEWDLVNHVKAQTCVWYLCGERLSSWNKERKKEEPVQSVGTQYIQWPPSPMPNAAFPNVPEFLLEYHGAPLKNTECFSFSFSRWEQNDG